MIIIILKWIIIIDVIYLKQKEENKIEDSQEITEIKDKRELITTPSMPTNQNTQNLFFKKSELKEIKEIQKEERR